MSSADPEQLQLESVRISAAGAAEMDGARPLLFLPREEIVRMEVRYGSAAERPLVSAVLGVILIIIAIVPLGVVIVAMLRGAGAVTAKLATAVVFAIPGWWLLDLSLRRRFYLAVTLRRDERKLVFHKTADREAIEDFVAKAKLRFGYV